jgi:hypothetical protein
MQRLSTWVLGIIATVVAGVAVYYLTQRQQETINAIRETADAAPKFLLYLLQQTWFLVTALLLVGFVGGLWVDWFLRKLDRSRAKERQALGVEMRIIASDLPRLGLHQLRPQIMSCLISASKLGIWVPDHRVFEILPDFTMNMITDYLTHVGTFLRDGNFSEAKQYALNSKANFNKALADFRPHYIQDK